MSSLGEEYPKEQARVRAIRDQYVECRGMPQVNVEFAIALMDAALKEADEAAVSGDLPRMIRAYSALKEFEG